MKTFLKSSELVLINGGYLSNKKDEAPVFNEQFVGQQKHAEFIVAFAAECKGKNFKQVEVANVESIRNTVLNSLNEKNKVEFVKGPKKAPSKMTDALAKEAMAFIDFDKSKSKVDKINNFLSQFETIHDFEENGLFFEEGIVKLGKIYTMKEIISAVTEVIELV